MPGSHVLAYVGRQRQAEGLAGQPNKSVDPLRRADARHSGGVKAADVTPHEEVGEGDQRVLEPRGHSDAHHVHDDLPLRLEAFEGQAEQRVVLFQAVVHHQDRYHLGDHRGDADAGHTPAEFCDEQQVQDDVQPADDHQDVEGIARVADGAQQSGAHIVDHGEHDASQVDPQVNYGFSVDFSWNGDQPHQPGRDQDAHYGERDAQDHGKCEGYAHGRGLAFRFSRAVKAGDDHRSPHGHAVEKADHELRDSGADADCREGVAAHKVPHHHGIHGVVKVLEKLAQHDRHRKNRKFLDDVSFSEINRFTHVFYVPRLRFLSSA